MKKTLTWLRRTRTLTVEQSSKQLLCRFLLPESEYLDEKTYFQHGITSC